MDRDTQLSFVRIGPNWIPLESYKQRKADRKAKIACAVFLVLLALDAFLLLWVTP